MLSVPEDEWWRLQEPSRVVWIMKEIGVSRLANFDGCICSSFSIRDVDVDISCGKGRDRGAWVSSHSMDYGDSDGWGDGYSLEPIAAELRKQLEGADMRGPIEVHIGPRPQPQR